jgi:membrane-bound lytic murein transglycosylase D
MNAGIRYRGLISALLIVLTVSGCAWQDLVRWDRDSEPAPLPEPSTRPAPQIVHHSPAKPTPPPEQVSLPKRATADSIPPPPVPDLWREIARASAPSDLRRPEVQKELAWFKGQRKFLRESAARATPYLYFIWTEIQEHQLPISVLYIPLLESGYRPGVVSPYGAAGLWQFMGATGAKFGLAKNEWVDERLNVVESTHAALKYFADLRSRFDGDWLLAVAAYNAGWGNIEKALAKNRRAGKPTDAWSLDLRHETRRLLARVVALDEIFRNPQAFGLKLPLVPQTPYFTSVTLTKPADLRKLAQLAEIDEATFQQLNPGFKVLHTGPNLPQQILVPSASAPKITEIAENFPAAPIPTRVTTASIPRLPLVGDAASQVYRVKSGDSLWLIARRFDMRVANLERLNGISRTRPLRLGQAIVVGKAAQAVAATPTSESPRPAHKRYKVRSGDSLWTISRQFKVTIAQLLAWNNLHSKSTLRPGQQLLVSKPT